MEETVLLGTKPLVDSIRHFIWDPSGVFSVCHLCEYRIVQWRHDSRLLLLLNWFLTSRLLSLYIIKRTLHGGSKLWILCSRGKNNISLVRYCSCHSNIKFISPPCNILDIYVLRASWGVYNKSIYATHACWIWDDYSWLSAPLAIYHLVSNVRSRNNV